MSIRLFACIGGSLLLPDRGATLASAPDGGNLVVHPPRAVWERSELPASELVQFAFLVAAAGRAMIDALPQLAGGCVNYWEAGNWALNDAAPPAGPKRAPDHRRMHLHLIGRSPRATDPRMRWGESPQFPPYAERATWAAQHVRLSAAECAAVVAQTAQRLTEEYSVGAAGIAARAACAGCGYPFVREEEDRQRCEECRGA